MSARYYHNPRCSKSRQGLALLQEQESFDFTVKEYLKEGLDVDEVADLAKALALHPSEFVRTKESVYAEATDGGSDFSVEEWGEILSEYPMLLERPILVVGQKARIGRPPEQLLEII